MDRIIACLEKLRETINQIKTKICINPDPTLTECMDTVLELLQPLCTFEENVENVADKNANVCYLISKCNVKNFIFDKKKIVRVINGFAFEEQPKGSRAQIFIFKLTLLSINCQFFKPNCAFL